MQTASREPSAIFIGCAGWSIPKAHDDKFSPSGSHLARYASRFSAVEINSSFYKRHRATTYARWAASVPDGFRFAVKAPKSITHEARLVATDEQLAMFLDDVIALGDRLGPILVQLPPSLRFEERLAARFFTAVRQRFAETIVCEPRHASWFTPAADRLLDREQVARVAADPAIVPLAAEPGGWPGLVYYRLHGSPRCYWSAYTDESLAAQAHKLEVAHQAGAQTWCIFDNTAAGAATENALALYEIAECAHPRFKPRAV